jgi:hypothetical protein
MNKIDRDSIGEELFNNIIDDFVEKSYSEHRRGSNFYTKRIFEVDEEYFPDHPELFGFWESNIFVADTEYGWDKCDIYELTRVEKKTRTIVEEYWEKVKDT